jgi:hypothetical protein
LNSGAGGIFGGFEKTGSNLRIHVRFTTVAAYPSRNFLEYQRRT